MAKSDMENSNMFSCVLFISLLFLSQHSCMALPNQKVALYVFGDSFFDVGNNNYLNVTARTQANFGPYGQTFFKFPSGRFCDGRVFPDFIAEYANLPLILPYLYPGTKDFTDGVNFASGGAGALDETVAGSVISFNTQLSNFKEMERNTKKKLGSRETERILSSAVYLIAIGNNDYAVFTIDPKLPHSYSMKEYVDLVIGNFTAAIQEIHKIGGRKFAVMNVGPLYRMPGMQKEVIDARVEELKPLAELHNQQLYKTLQKLSTKLSGFTYSHIDFYTAFNDIIDHPAKYGLKNVKSGCCGMGPLRGINSCGGKRGIEEYELCENPNEYFFFDSTHPTDRGYQILAEIMWNGTSNFTTPLNVKSLFYMNGRNICIIED